MERKLKVVMFLAALILIFHGKIHIFINPWVSNCLPAIGVVLIFVALGDDIADWARMRPRAYRNKR